MSDEVETILWESEARHSKPVKSKFGHRNLLSQWFWSYLDLKYEFERLKRAFSAFCKFLKIKLKRPKLFKSKLGHSKLLKKWFWNYLELKNEYCQRLKWAFFIFVQVFEWRSWNHFLVIASVLENGFEAPFSSKTNVLRVWKEHFLSFLQVLNDKVATLFWKGEAKRSKLFKL